MLIIRLSIFVQLLFLPIILFPQEFSTISTLRFSPPRYYIGDSVRLSFKFEVDPHANIVLPPYQKNDILVVDHIEFERIKRTVNVNIILRVFVPGTRSIQLNFGETKVSVPIYVSSVLNNHGGKELYMSYGPLTLRGTRLMVTFFVGFLIFLPASAYFFVKLCKKIIIYRKFFTSPRRQFYKRLRSLSLDRRIISDKIFYTKLLDGFRIFLSQHCCRDEFQTVTTNSMSQLFLEYYTEDETDEIMLIMNRGDLVKFGGKVMCDNERSQCLKKIIFFTKQLLSAERSS